MFVQVDFMFFVMTNYLAIIIGSQLISLIHPTHKFIINSCVSWCFHSYYCSIFCCEWIAISGSDVNKPFIFPEVTMFLVWMNTQSPLWTSPKFLSISYHRHNIIYYTIIVVFIIFYLPCLISFRWVWINFLSIQNVPQAYISSLRSFSTIYFKVANGNHLSYLLFLPML